jgi:hypothetical protein
LLLHGVSADTVTIEDFDDIVTENDFGFSDFFGGGGVTNSGETDEFGQTALSCEGPSFSCAMRFSWDFVNELEAFTGIFMSIFGPIETRTTFDGSNVETIAFPEHSLDLDDVDGGLNSPQGLRKYLKVCIELSYQGVQPLELRTELKDVADGLRFTRLHVTNAAEPQVHCWDFRDPASYTISDQASDLNIHQAKILTFIIERQNIADNVDNPVSGVLDIHHIWFISDTDETAPIDDEAYLDLLAFRLYQYFYDWSSRKPESAGIPQDRSTFGDLLSVGGIGFALPAHITAVQRGWISRSEAADVVLNVLRVLDNPNAFCSDPVGCIGYKGWFYHFLGTDGRRKLNFDFDDTDIDESLNTVELSAIDTGLAIIGVISTQTFFNEPNDPVEIEIRERAQNIYDRVDWSFMLEPELQTFYLGWKPVEEYEGPAFEVPDGEGTGFFSGTPGHPATLDFYTDEALILFLLASGSKTHPVSPFIYNAIIRAPSEDGLIRTFPGALFTYQFFHAFIDTQHFLGTCPGVDARNWYENSRQAIWATINYVEANPLGLPTYSRDAWGISASERPFDDYGANGVPDVAIDPAPQQDGTVTYYAMLSAVSFGDDLKARAIDTLKTAWSRGHWHPRFGLPDAFHDDISYIAPPEGITPLRTTGPWVQRALFSIDQGPMLLHLENERSGLIWRTLNRNSNIRYGLQRLSGIHQLTLEAEDGVGDGVISIRNTASYEQALLLQDGESRTWLFNAPLSTNYSLRVRYSNDNDGPTEIVELFLEGSKLGEIATKDTGDGGFGWNVFVKSAPITLEHLKHGEYELVAAVSGGDGYGLEIDNITLDMNHYCQYLPAIFR